MGHVRVTTRMFLNLEPFFRGSSLWITIVVRFLRSHFPMLDPTTIDALERPVNNDEIKRVLFDMTPFKALRVDGFHAQFY